MGQLSRIAVLAVALLFALVSSAFADHMNGTYTGTGTAAGTTLQLQQRGTDISGQFYGTLNGSFSGRTDGANYGEGLLTDGVTNYTYFLNWSQNELRITLYDTSGNQVIYSFAPGAAGTGTQEPPLDTEAPAQNFYVAVNGAQDGPFSLEQLTAKIAAGEIGRDTLVWQPGQPQWLPAADIAELAALMPPEPPPVVRYYVTENGQPVGPLTLEEVLARIAAGTTIGTDLAWKDGLEAWTPASGFAEFAEALTPEAPPPPPPPPPPPSPEPEPVPPPPPPPDTPPPPPAPEPPPPAPEPEAPPTEPEPTPPDAPQPPPAPDTEVPAPNPVGDSSDAAWNTAVMAFIADEMPEAPAETQAAIVICTLAAMEPLSADERALMVSKSFDLSAEERDQLNNAHAGFSNAVDDCLALGETDGGDDSNSSSVSLPDGRSLVIVGPSDGGEQSVAGVDGGYEIKMGGKDISFINGELKVDGAVQPVPDFTTSLEIRIDNGDVTLKAD